MITATRWEQALIGTVLGFPGVASSVGDVRPQDMGHRSHQILWTQMISLDRGNRLSYRAVAEALIASRELDTLGADVGDGNVTGEMYLTELLSRRAEESAREFADKVVGASVKRQCYEAGHLIALDAQSDIDADELLDKMEERILAMRRSQLNTGLTMAELLGEFDQRMDEWRAGNVQPAFVFSTPGLSNLIQFLEPTDFMVVAGRPGEAKSSLIRFEAFEAARRGQKVAIFNLENGELEYARYLLAYMTHINSKQLRDPRLLTEEEVTRVKAAIRQLRAMPIRIVSLGAPTVFEVIRIARKLALEGYEVFFLDYIQLIKNGPDNEVADITISTTMLRGAALKMGKPWIAAAQLNRSIVHRGVDAEPELSDLRASGSLEQDAVQVAFTRIINQDEDTLRLFPENVVNGQTIVRAVPIRVFVKKNRNGPVGKTPPIKWDKAVNTFAALANDDGSPMR